MNLTLDKFVVSNLYDRIEDADMRDTDLNQFDRDSEDEVHRLLNEPAEYTRMQSPKAISAIYDQ
jgi:hypothetical protein